MENRNNVAHVTSMTSVSQQSHSILVFAPTPSSKFNYNVTLYNIDILEKNIEKKQIFNNWNVVQLDFLELSRTESIHSTHEKVKKFSFFFFQLLISMQLESKSTKKAQIVFIWLSCILLEPKGTSLSKATNTLKFVN